MSECCRRNSVVGGVLILTLAGLIVKMIGVFYKVPLSYLLGDEGMGYFNVSYTIYAWLYMLSTAGIPVALSILISEARARGDGKFAHRVVRTSSLTLIAIGAVSATALLIGAKPIASLLGSIDAWYTIAAIAPTLFFISLSAFFRGVFQGYGNMLPTALSQLVEAVGKVVFGMVFAYLALSRGYSAPFISAFAVLGVTIGTACSVLYLILHYIYARSHNMFMKKGDQGIVGARHVTRRLFAIALPVTVSASVMSLTGLIDLGMIIRRLVSIGYTHAEATALYGNYTTLVVPMFNLPSVLITPIATGIIPELSRAHAMGDREACNRLLSGAFRTVGILAVPCAVGFAAFAKPILSLMYPASSVESAYKLLIYIAPAVIFLCLLSLVNATLQACGSPRVPMLAMLLGGSVKVVTGYFLLGRLGIAGSPLGTMMCYFTALAFGLIVLARRVGYLPSIESVFIKPLAASILAIGVVAIVYYKVFDLSAHRIGVLLCVAAAIVLYVGGSFLLGSVKKDEIILLLKKRKKTKIRTE